MNLKKHCNYCPRRSVKQLWLIKLCITVSYFDNENAGDNHNNDLERERGIITSLLKCFGGIQRNEKSTLLILLVTPISVVVSV
jgi:hypothetical protein